MKPKLLLRIASVIMFLHDLGHTFGHLTWKQALQPAKQEVIKQMTDNKFPFMGAVRSMSEYYDGYGFASTLALLFIAIILWIASGVTEQTKVMVKNILILTFIILLAWGVDELIFFFPFAASFSLLAALPTVLALSSLNSSFPKNNKKPAY